jgi:activator of HSP90 ATPase
VGEIRNPAAPPVASTRRQVIVGIAGAFGGLAASSRVCAQPQQAMKEIPSTATDQTRTSLHQAVDFDASPARIYEILLDSKQFAAFTGMPAKIDSKAGGAFSMFAGMIVGRNVELIPSERIVQAWRATHWDPGVYSIVRFELTPQASGTLIVLDHTGFPEGEYDHLYPGWGLRYWTPLKNFLARSG